MDIIICFLSYPNLNVIGNVNSAKVMAKVYTYQKGNFIVLFVLYAYKQAKQIALLLIDAFNLND